jgi:adenylate cyclase
VASRDRPESSGNPSPQIEGMDDLLRAYESLVPVPLDVAHPSLPEMQVRETSILISSMHDLTAIAEQLSSEPDLLLSVLDEHFRVAVRAVVQCGGAVEKFLGDGLFAAFGAWTDTPNHAARALTAAIAIIGAHEALNQRRAPIWGFRLEVGVGLCSGRVAVGTMGPPERCELAIVGDPVNIATALASVAEPSEVLLTESTYRAVNSQSPRLVSAELLGSRTIRGRVDGIALYRLQLAGGRS